MRLEVREKLAKLDTVNFSQWRRRLTQEAASQRDSVILQQGFLVSLLSTFGPANPPFPCALVVQRRLLASTNATPAIAVHFGGAQKCLYNPSTSKAEARETQVQGQSGLYSERETSLGL